MNTSGNQWDEFLTAAEAFLKEQPSRQWSDKLRYLVNNGSVSADLFPIFNHLLSLDDRYDPSEWWSEEGYRPLFRTAHRNPLFEFIPGSFRQLAKKAGAIAERTFSYVEYHREAQTKALHIIDRDLDADERGFEPFLNWASKHASSSVSVSCKLLSERARNKGAVWPLYWYAHQKLTDYEWLGYQDEMSDLHPKARKELRGCPWKVDEALRVALRLPEWHDVDVEICQERIRFHRREIAWCDDVEETLRSLVNASLPGTLESNPEEQP